MYISLIGVVVYKDSLLLIQKLDPDGKIKYILPGGHWDFPEMFSNGAIREVYEETGVKSEKIKLLQIRYNKKKKRIEFYYLLKYISSTTNLIPIEKAEENNKIFIPMFIKINDLHNLRVKTLGMLEIINKIQRRKIKELVYD